MTPAEPSPSLDLRERTITTYIVHEIASHLSDLPVGSSVEVVTDPEEMVFPMVPAGADLHKMIRRPKPGER